MLPIHKAAQLIGVHEQTLRKWEKEGKIAAHRTPGGQRRYDPVELRRFSGDATKASIIYCRVSSRNQQGDLERQIERMRREFVGFDVISDIGSGVHYNRPGFRQLLERILRGDVGTIAVAYRDRLGRFGYELFERVAQFFGTKIVVLHQDDAPSSNELADDVVAVITLLAAQAQDRRRDANSTSETNQTPDSGSNTDDPEALVHSGASRVQSGPGDADPPSGEDPQV